MKLFLKLAASLLIASLFGTPLNSCQPKDNQTLDNSKDFSVQFRIKTNSSEPTVLLSQKLFPDKSISSQKNKGWVLYSSGGTFAWSVGSGDRRLNYERDNGSNMPLDDGKWHQITMTYSRELSEFRLYYDGHNRAIYKVEFDFSNDMPLQIGLKEEDIQDQEDIFPEIEKGKILLQDLVDEFNSLDIGRLNDRDLINLIVDPDDLVEERVGELDQPDLTDLKNIRKELMKSPYTVYQNMKLTLLKPVSKIYYLDEDEVKLNLEVASMHTQQTRLFPSDFAMKKLVVSDRVMSPEEVLEAYNRFGDAIPFPMEKNVESLNVGVWNIWHGGIHWNVKDDGWDSRMRIIEMIRENDIDIVLMQETYSSGDYIAAELGYYFATSSDWDYCFQGSNISVLSRYPISELHVPFEASFMNVGAKLSLSKGQEIFAMSNWYGMASFPIVYDFHVDRFNIADNIPVLFGGDFNAVPHTDGGRSPASEKMLENGFIDAYRSLHPDSEEYPGYTHRGGRRIDQLYYKGKSLKNTSTEVISDWPGGFPSDHYLIFSKFELK